MTLSIPTTCLVVLIGASGSGKSSFARRHFLPTEIISSDTCRGLISDDETSLDATVDAFDLVHFIAGKRLARNRLAVIDATSVQQRDRKPLIELARKHHTLAIAIVLDVPERVCHERNRSRPDRQFGPHVVRRHTEALRKSLRGLRREGFQAVHVLEGVEAVESAVIERTALFNDRRSLAGPFDIIGDVHGCYDELVTLLETLGYEVERETDAPHGHRVTHPEDRTAIFVGDLVDRGPASPAVLRLVMSMTETGSGLSVVGNHDDKLLRKMIGRNVQITHGLAETLAQLDAEPPEFLEAVRAFLHGLRSHYVLDGGKLVVAHAGLREEMHGRASATVRDFAMYGETTGESDEYGLPVRINWAADYRGTAMVVYGHTPVLAPEWLNNTIDVDTGCVFGGSLTALRYPERQLVSVPAAREYYAPARPIAPATEAFTSAPGATRQAAATTTAPAATTAASAAARTAQQEHDDLLDIEDVIGRRMISTRLQGAVTIGEEHATAALEVLSRFAADPHWLIYLPPTMSPSATSQRAGLLEHPDEAFAYFQGEGVETVICQEKHMGSRVSLVVCQDEESARRAFGTDDGRTGLIYTRTGRPFFSDDATERAVLDRVRAALTATGLWDKLGTSWVLLDGELMPWSAKAQGLLERQYAAVGAAATAALADATAVLQRAQARGGDTAESIGRLKESFQRRTAHVAQYRAAYRRYCWPVASVDDLALAPFQLLASEGTVHVDRDHGWQMATLAALADADAQAVAAAGHGRPILRATPHRVVPLADPTAVAEATSWWEDLTARGGEGMVVKPLQPIVQSGRKIVQPALKVRGSEYLRIIYGPEYLEPEHLQRLRARAVGRKRSLALRELALGIEGLERFVRREPLRRVHECVAGVLALESEPIDPRL